MSHDEFTYGVLLGIPAATAVLAWCAAARSQRAAVGLGIVGSLVTLAWSIALLIDLWSGSGFAASGGDGSARAPVDHVWIASLDVRWSLAVDGISGPLILLTTLVTVCCLVSLVRHAPAGGDEGQLAALLLLIESGVLGAFLATDMVLFFAFFEVALIPMWFVIHRFGDPHDPGGRQHAANRFLVFTVLGSALMLVGFVLVRSETGTFDILAIMADPPRGGTITLAATLVGIGLAVKTPLWPVHIWLPDAHAKAPTVGSVVLAALLLKLGTYGFIRFWLPLVDPGDAMLTTFAALAVIGIVYGALACLAQTELKRLIAYSSVGHMGFVVLAVATYTFVGVQAAVFASVAHGLITGLLFFVAGAVKDRYGTGDLGELTALYGVVPRLAGVLAFAAMASLGLPGLAGFWGEMLAIRAALEPHGALPAATFTVLAVIAALGVILTSAYFLKLLRGTLQSGTEVLGAAVPVSPRSPSRLLDLTAAEWIAWSPLIALTVLLGVAPGLLLEPVAGSFAGVLG